MSYFYSFILALTTSFFLMPFLIRMAKRINLVDEPDSRKVHREAIPRVGGIAVVIAFLFAYLVLAPGSQVVKGIATGAFIVAFVGLLDDFSNISPYVKFLGQAIAAIVGISMSGLSINAIDFFGFFKLELGPFGYIFTVLWIIGITNAINLIDGLDGLAGGIATIALFFLGLIGYLQNSMPTVFLAATLVGATLGFLKYNAHPAKVFMGDVGSLFLGYTLGMLAMIGSTKAAAVMTLALPITILGLPIFDTAWAFTRRLLKGKNPFLPDKQHIHHRLMDLGLGHGLTVMFMYGVAILLGMIAVFSVYQYELKTISLVIVLGAMIFAAFKLIIFLRNRPTLKSIFKRRLVDMPRSFFVLLRVTLYLPLIIRNLIIVALSLNILILAYTPIEGVIIGLILFGGLAYLYFSENRVIYEQFMMFVMYLCGMYIIFVAEQVIDPVIWFGLSMEVFSNVLYSVIGGLVILNIMVKQLSGNFLSRPFEFFILLFVISLNLLPPDIVIEYHLAAISIKSVILFLGYRLLLDYHMEKSRRLVFASEAVILFTVAYSVLLYFNPEFNFPF